MDIVNKNLMAYRSEKIAVIDTETNYDDQVMSIGVVIADAKTYAPVYELYHVIDPEYRKPSMFGYVLDHSRARVLDIMGRRESIAIIKQLLKQYNVAKIYAYNAKFDKYHLPELKSYSWFDIMGLAAYRQYNHSIPDDCPCCKTGRMKSGYGAEQIYRMLSGNCSYGEVHNALADAVDELEIMRMLGHPIEEYERAKV